MVAAKSEDGADPNRTLEYATRINGAIAAHFAKQRDTIVARMLANPEPAEKSVKGVNDAAKAWGVTASMWDDALKEATKGPLQDLINLGGVEGWRKVEALRLEVSRDKPEVQVGPRTDFGVDAPEILDAMDRETNRFVRSVNSTTEDAIRATLADGIENGESISQLADRVRAEFEAFTPARAETIARSESARFVSAGTEAQWKSMGVRRKRWLLAGGACPLCESFAQQYNEAALDEPFAPMGTTVTGLDGVAYSLDFADIMGPPVHPNDRCDMVPVVEGWND